MLVCHMSFYMLFHMGSQGPSIPYLQAYLIFPPWQRLLSILPVFPSSSQVPRTIPWALIYLCKPSHDLLALMAQPQGAPMLICACHIHAVYFSVLLLLGLGLGAPHWLVLGITPFSAGCQGLHMAAA